MDEDVRVYGGTAITCIVIAVVNVICNLFLGLPAELNIKWIIFGGTSVAAFYFIQKNRYIQPMAILVYLVAILVNLPLTFIEEGEIGRPFVIYIAAIVVAISFLIKGNIRYVLLCLLVGVLGGISFLQIQFPWIADQAVYRETQENGALDNLVQMILVIMSVSVISMICANQWRRSREKQILYAKELERKNEKLEWYANHDYLTGVYNRKYFFQQLELMTKEIESYLLIVDIDSFKKINDSFGHIEGDRVLIELADTLKKHKLGTVCRYGGDEFLVLIQGVQVKEIRQMVNNLKKKISQIMVGQEPLCISGGMVRLSEEISHVNSLADADKLLYQVKKNGKNDIIFNA